jgi:YD repeat-containing protein
MAHYNAVNQLTSFNNESFIYDANGNLKDDGVRTYQWDAENRLLSIGYKNDASKTTTFRYDGMGRRLAIVETNGGATTETRHLWCGDVLCQARTAGDVVTRRYYPEGMAIPQGGTLLYYGTDHLGSGGETCRELIPRICAAGWWRTWTRA